MHHRSATFTVALLTVGIGCVTAVSPITSRLMNEKEATVFSEFRASSRLPDRLNTETLSSSSAESEIRSAVEGYREAVLHKDMRRITRYYWNSPDIVIFDVVPPLSYVGWDSFRKDWEDYFASFKEITVFDWSDLHIEAEGNLGWMHAFIHFVGKFQNDKILDLTTRDTAIFERKDGRWVAVHDHGSVPIIFETGQAVMNAPPK